MSSLRRLLVALLLLAGLPVAARAVDSAAVLGADGEIYRVLPATGTDDDPVLILEVVRSGSPPQRLLVPGSEGAATEKYPAITVDKGTNTVFVVWEAQETIHSTLHLVGYTADGWSENFEISGDPFSFKSSPQVAATTDSFSSLEADGSLVAHRRVVLHLVWWDEKTAAGRPLYTALLVEDGEFVPAWEVFALTDFLPPGETIGNGPIGLYHAPQVRATGDGRAAMVSFGDRGSNRLATIEVQPLAGSLVSFADAARAQIIDVGRRRTGTLSALAEEARGQIIDVGRRLLDAEVAAFLTARVTETIAQGDPAATIDSIADQARAQIIDVGARLHRGARLVVGEGRAQIIDVGRATHSSSAGHPTGVRVASQRAAPWVPDRAITLLSSEEGDEMALAWDFDGSVKYRMSQGSDWGDVRTLQLDATLSREQARALIVRRLAQR
jgi:hypothetical protein